MWFDWITASASARSLLIAGPVTVDLLAEPPVGAGRSGLVARRADLFCWAIINAGIARAITRKSIPGAKDLFLTQPPKTEELGDARITRSSEPFECTQSARRSFLQKRRRHVDAAICG